MKLDFLKEFEFFTGVPDSQLKALCDYLMSVYGISPRHVIAANEGNCVALAAGYHLATGKVPVVYLQNSGIGNIINPVASLMNDRVYGIPCVFIVGWRGEPGFPDEPQHVYQGEVTLKLLGDMDIQAFVIEKDTAEAALRHKLEEFQTVLKAGKQVAFVVRKGALEYEGKALYGNDHEMRREEIIRRVVIAAADDVIVSTTGKASRELYEIREARDESHHRDFLTVGSMGHCSSIALGIAMEKPDRRIWCLDGDGSALMHMGAMAVIGSVSPGNLVHVVMNNEAHETVGGMPTVAGKVDFGRIAEGCGYARTYRAESYEQLEEVLQKINAEPALTFLEATCGLGARENLGRPANTPGENKEAFMEFLANDLERH